MAKAHRESRRKYPDLPSHHNQLNFERFAQWVIDTGRIPVMPTNEYETMRWRNLAGLTCLVYEDKHGNLVWNARSAEDYRAFMKGGPAND